MLASLSNYFWGGGCGWIIWGKGYVGLPLKLFGGGGGQPSLRKGGGAKIKMAELPDLQIRRGIEDNSNIQSNFNGSNTFGTMQISSRQG